MTDKAATYISERIVALDHKVRQNTRKQDWRNVDLAMGARHELLVLTRTLGLRLDVDAAVERVPADRGGAR